MRWFGLLVLAVALVAGIAPARAGLNFDFSFTNQDPDGVPGTVTGEIFGLTDNSTMAAADIVIDSCPASMGFGMPSTPWDIFNAAGFSINANSFTVREGEVTSGDFQENDGAPALSLGADGYLSVLRDGSGDVTGFLSATFAPAAPTPAVEPASILVLLSALCWLGLVRRRGTAITVPIVHKPYSVI
jgi:hypothetical protein